MTVFLFREQSLLPRAPQQLRLRLARRQFCPILWACDSRFIMGRSTKRLWLRRRWWGGNWGSLFRTFDLHQILILTSLGVSIFGLRAADSLCWATRLDIGTNFEWREAVLGQKGQAIKRAEEAKLMIFGSMSMQDSQAIHVQAIQEQIEPSFRFPAPFSPTSTLSSAWERFVIA